MNERTLALAVMDDDGYGCAITSTPVRAGESLMDLELLALDALAAVELVAENRRNTKAGS